MSFDILGHLNWLAVIVGTIVYFAIGAVWFTPMLFGRPWQRSIGWDPSKTAPQMNPVTYAVPAVLYLVASIADWPRAGLAVLGGLIGLAAMVSLAVAGGTTSGGFFAVQLVLAALALGSVAAAMLLGHWYLVTPSLSPQPLRRMVWLLVAALALQALAFAVAVATVHGEALSGSMGWLTWLRLVAGTLLPIGIAVLAILASRAASLQASTGLLYIALALVMAGSIAGASISYLTGVPV